jgi:hypothetical protein
MATKNNPGAYDCYANAFPDEPMFVLLARDRTAPSTVRYWVQQRQMEGKTDQAKLDEALACADAMEAWQCSRSSTR